MSGKTIILRLDPVDITLLAVTLVLSSMTFASSRTNVLLVAVHLLLFFAYILLIFQRLAESCPLQRHLSETQ